MMKAATISASSPRSTIVVVGRTIGTIGAGA